jgi:hypothetical protein
LARTVRIAATCTWAVLGLLLAIAFLSPLPEDDITRGVYPGLASIAGIVIFVSIGVLLFLQPFRIHTRRYLPFAIAALSVVVVLFPISLWYLGREGLGFQFFQSLRVGTSPYGFGDLEVTLSWLDCVRLEIDAYGPAAATCAIGPANYGPGWLWLASLGIGPQHTAPIGIAVTLLTGVVVAWMARFTSGIGQIALLVVVISPSWILLVERGNFDLLVVWCAVLLVWLVRRMPDRLLPWVIGAIPIWILGTWKYYPFAMVLALLPVVRIRRGWVVIAAFLGAALLYLTVFRDTVLLSVNSNANLSGGNLWGIGRDVLAAIVGGQEKSDTAIRWPDLLIVLMIAAAFIWGWCAKRTPARLELPGIQKVPFTGEAMLAIGGSSSVLVAVGFGGFGYQYKAALLILTIPLLIRLADRGSPEVWRSAVAMVLLVVIGSVVVWNVATSSIAVLVAAAFTAGVSLRCLMTWIHVPQSSTIAR